MTSATTCPWVDFDDLSPAAQRAISHQTDIVHAAELVTYARRKQWQEERVPTTTVIERVMATGDHADDFDGDWAAYHAWYVSQGGVPDHGTSRWPVIENPLALRGACGYLDDGWHRLHSYIRAGDTHIPVLRHRPHPAATRRYSPPAVRHMD